MLSLLEKYGFLEKAWIISFNQEPLVRVRELDKDVKLSYLTNKVKQKTIDFCLENDIDGVDFNKEKTKEKGVKMVIDAGLVPQVWTVDTIEVFEEYYSLGVRFFTGNCLTY